jgi:Mn2+/Fe2+ NRAMP family transporter
MTNDPSVKPDNQGTCVAGHDSSSIVAPKKSGFIQTIGPGILVAATGVGAGDLITASIAGSKNGVAIIWAALWGAALKWALTEGIARWHLATGTSLLEGWINRFGKWVAWIFLPYFFLWTFMVGGALVNACGIAATALLPIGNTVTSKICWGVIHSVIGYAIVRIGGFKVFQRVMSVCVACMFVGVLSTGALLVTDWSATLAGALIPTIPRTESYWVVAVLGGVGGTVTLMSYGYWIQEKGRVGLSGLRTCRIDLAVAYALTGLFGAAMIVVGSGIVVQQQGVQLSAQLATRIGATLGPSGRFIFLVGFWSAVFGSLLGVWQSVPYLFADYVRLRQGNSRINPAQLSSTRPYKLYSTAISTAPLLLLWFSVQQIQLGYAILGALFMPLLALTLIVLNSNASAVGREFRTGIVTNVVLSSTVAVSFLMGGWEVLQILRK